MSAKRYTARAIVQLTVEVAIAQGWDEGATCKQVHEQAVESAIGILQRVLVVDGMTNVRNRDANVPSVNLRGEPRVLNVIAEEDRR